MANSDEILPPPDCELLPVVERLRSENPSLGIPKLLVQLKVQHPEWAVSEKRLRKVLQGLPSASSSTYRDDMLVTDTGMDPSIDIAHLAPKLKVKMFPGGRGKGLVAKEKMLQGEVLWQEEPWISTADPNMYSYLLSKRMCTQCLTMFNQTKPLTSAGCPYCDQAHFCNRLCLSRARSSASHHDLLCSGQNPPALELLTWIRQRGARHLDAVVKIIARWRGERDFGDMAKAREVERRVWSGMARVNQQSKEKERREWPVVAEARLLEWKTAHDLVVRVLNPRQSDANYKSFQKLLTNRHRTHAKPEPLSSEEEHQWFSFDSFLDLLGLVGLNQESSGGLYALHAHLNHSCEPNIQVRNLPKSYSPPTSLPSQLPPPNPPGVRGTNKLTILARRTIHPGDELCISYVNFTLPREERRQTLREEYGFWCSCPKCEREKSTNS